MKKMGLAGLLLWVGVAAAAGESNGYRELTEIYLNEHTVNFYLDEQCPNGVPYWRLDANHIDVDKGYVLLLAAFSNKQKVYVVYQNDPTAKEQCMVKRINVR